MEKCQIGVFLGYAKGSYRTLIDGRLYLPRNWARDKHRQHDAGIPEEVVFKSKAEIGLESALEDAKGIADLADYEVGSLRGWHHHVAMSLLAMMVLLTMNIELGRKADFLTLQDVKEIL